MSREVLLKTILSFLFQAPASMKSVLQSFWLLTVAFGDLIVVILASVLPAMGVVSLIVESVRARWSHR